MLIGFWGQVERISLLFINQMDDQSLVMVASVSDPISRINYYD